MPASVSAVRADLLADAQDNPFPSPQPIDLASDVIPYGATVRFAVEMEAEESIHPLWAYVISHSEAVGAHQFLFAHQEENVYQVEVRLPALLVGGEQTGASSPPVFPGEVEEWPTASMGGEYRLEVTPWALGAVSEADKPPTATTPLRLGPPPGPGGGAPRIVSLETGVENGRVRLGQPWLARATVEDPDDDVMAVVFSGVVGGLCRWWVMRDDGRYGDEQARDRVYSFLRVGGDWWDRPETGLGRDVPAAMAVQAVDLRGNWSQPVVFDYTLCRGEAPLWMEKPDPGGPNIVEAGLSREQGPFTHPLLWARCDSQEAWVCARKIFRPDMTCGLYDDGQGPDREAGDGIHSTVIWFPDDRRTDVVYYAVPKAGPVRTGEKQAVVCPPLRLRG